MQGAQREVRESQNQSRSMADRGQVSGTGTDQKRHSGYREKPKVHYTKREFVPNRRFVLTNKKKLVIVFVVIIAAMAGLIFRLNYINLTRGDVYAKQVLSQMNYDGQTIPYRRGDILDRNGTVLATSEKVYNLVVDAYVMKNSKVEKDGDCLEPTLKVIGNYFGGSGVNVEEVRDYIQKNPENRYYIAAKQLSYEIVQAYNDFFEKDEEGSYINEEAPYVKGIWFEEDYVRKYPYGDLGGDVIGFSYAGNTADYGLEGYYNNELNGTNGREYGYLEDGILERSVVSPVNGNSIVTTLDINVMQIVHKHIAEYNEAIGSKNTAVIVQKVDTGEILAMESYPFMDPNDPYDISDYVSEERWAEMSDEEKLKARQAIWRNFCVSDTYEPGSVEKLITVASAMDEHTQVPEDTFVCGGGITFPDGDKTIKVACNNTSGHGQLDLSGALEHSCNVALMEIGLKLGQERMVKAWNNFGIGLKTNIDLPGEVSGIVKNAGMSELDLAITSFGQSINVTMVQMASAVSSIVNGGNYYRPHLVSEIRSEGGSIVQSFDKELVRTTLSAETSQWMRGAMEATVSEPTASGHLAYIEGYRIGGKTGTAEKLPREADKHLVSFICAAPIDDPEVIVYAIIDEASLSQDEVSKLPTVLARKILEDLLPYMQIFPEGVQTDEPETDVPESDGTGEGGQTGSGTGDGNSQTGDTGAEGGNGQNGDSGAEGGNGQNGDGSTAETGAEGEEDNFEEEEAPLLTEQQRRQLIDDYLQGKGNIVDIEYIRE